MTEEELLKRRWKKRVGICQMCGRMYYKSNADKRKFCPDCLVKFHNKFKKYLSDDDFKVLYKIFLPYIKRCIYIFRQNSFINIYILHQATIALWLHWNRLAKTMDVNEICTNTKKAVFCSVKYSYYTVMRHEDLPSTIYNKAKAYELIESEMQISRLDEPVNADTQDPLVDFLADERVEIDKLMDLRNLTKQIITESIVDSDIKTAIIKAETEDIFVGNKYITPEEKIDFINKEYDLNLKNQRVFKEKAIKGVHKLYNLYAEDIQDILGIAENNFRLKTNGRLGRKNYKTTEISRCPICGKAFVNIVGGNKNVGTCNNPRCKQELKNKQKRERRKKNEIEELMIQTRTVNDVEKKQALCEKLYEKISQLEKGLIC